MRDSYTGYFRAPGMTTVYFEEKPSWTMAYAGGGQVEGFETIAQETFTFLKNALMRVSPHMPFRGPHRYREDDWTYAFRLLRGDITDFLGDEIINNGSTRVFSQTVMGGLVLSKDSDRNSVYPWSL